MRTDIEVGEKAYLEFGNTLYAGKIDSWNPEWNECSVASKAARGITGKWASILCRITDRSTVYGVGRLVVPALGDKMPEAEEIVE